jgi:hypothetical protein
MKNEEFFISSLKTWAFTVGLFEPQRGDTSRDMCRPSGARFATDGIGYKYVAPLGLSDLAELNDIAREG